MIEEMKEEQRERARAVRERIEKNDLTQQWLLARLEEEKIETNKCEISGIFAGRRVGMKVGRILDKAEEIIGKYERGMA